MKLKFQIKNLSKWKEKMNKQKSNYYLKKEKQMRINFKLSKKNLI